MPTVKCPNQACGKTYQVSEESLGGRARCKTCGSVIELKWSGGESDGRPTPGRLSGSTPAETSQPSDTNASVSQTSGQPEIPETLGRFKIQSVLGAGAFGTVYRAYDPVLQREVALKVPQASVVGNKEAAARFLREAKAAAQLTHPNIVPIFDAGADGQQVFIASKYIAGHTLDDAIAKGSFDHQRAAEIVRQLAEALAYAHDQGVVHRDIKPANIMLDKQGQPHVMDFGLARLADEHQKLTLDGSLLGTPAYMSPEQAGEPGLEVGSASDQYSLGVVLYELLCHQRPFSGPLAAMIYQIRKEEPPAPRTIRSAISLDLEVICLKAMAKEPRRRYPSCQHLADELNHWLNGEPILARPITRLERNWRWCKRNPVLAGTGIAAAVCLIAVAVVSTVSAAKLAASAKRERVVAKAERDALGEAGHQRDSAIAAAEQERQARKEEAAAKEAANVERETAKQQAQLAQRERDTANRHLYLSHMQLAQQAWKAGNTARVLELLEGQRPGPDEPDLRHWEWYYLLAQCHTELATLKGHSSGVAAVAWSPNGERLASASHDETIKVWDAITMEELSTLRGHRQRVKSVVWSPDGRWLVSGDGSLSKKLWDATSGNEVLADKFKFKRTVTWTPDGQRMLIDSESYDATTLEKLADLDETAVAGSAAWSPDRKFVALFDRGEIKNITVWDALRSQKKLTQYGSDFAWSPNGKWLALGPGRVVNVADWKDAFRTEQVGRFAWSQDSKFLAVLGKDEIHVTDVALQREVLMDGAPPGAVEWSADGNRLAAIGHEVVKVWNVNTWRVVEAVRYRHTGESVASGHGSRNRVIGSNPSTAQPDLTWSVDHRWFGLRTAQEIQIWDASTLNRHFALRHSDLLTSIAWSPVDERLATSAGGSVQVWHAATGEESLLLRGHVRVVNSVTWHPDAKRLASASEDGTIKIWDVTVRPEYIELGHKTTVPSVAWNPDNQRLASVSQEGTIKVWDIAQKRDVLTLQVEPARFQDEWQSLNWSADGRQLVIAWDRRVPVLGSDGNPISGRWSASKTNVKAWQILEGEDAREVNPDMPVVGVRAKYDNIRPHVGFVAQESPSGERLASGDRNKEAAVHVWTGSLAGLKVEPGKKLAPLFTLRGHTGEVTAVAWRQDETRLASASVDGTIIVWDLSSLQEVLTLTGIEGGATDLAWSPNGTQLASARSDGTILVWDATKGYQQAETAP